MQSANNTECKQGACVWSLCLTLISDRTATPKVTEEAILNIQAVMDEQIQHVYVTQEDAESFPSVIHLSS